MGRLQDLMGTVEDLNEKIEELYKLYRLGEGRIIQLECKVKSLSDFTEGYYYDDT